MQPPDVMFLEVMIAAVAMIVFGLMIPTVSVMLWFGLAIAIAIGVWWIVSRSKRHGAQY